VIGDTALLRGTYKRMGISPAGPGIPKFVTLETGSDGTPSRDKVLHHPSHSKYSLLLGKGCSRSRILCRFCFELLQDKFYLGIKFIHESMHSFLDGDLGAVFGCLRPRRGTPVIL
jgi:hypothetical protein